MSATSRHLSCLILPDRVALAGRIGTTFTMCSAQCCLARRYRTFLHSLDTQHSDHWVVLDHCIEPGWPLISHVLCLDFHQARSTARLSRVASSTSVALHPRQYFQVVPSGGYALFCVVSRNRDGLGCRVDHSFSSSDIRKYDVRPGVLPNETYLAVRLTPFHAAIFGETSTVPAVSVHALSWACRARWWADA